MGWTKNLAIKRISKSVLKDTFTALNVYMEEKPSMSVEAILQDPNFHRRIPVKGLTGREERKADDVIQKFTEDNDIFSLVMNIVVSIVMFELSYDETMGTQEDLTLIYNIVAKFLENIR